MTLTQQLLATAICNRVFATRNQHISAADLVSLRKLYSELFGQKMTTTCTSCIRRALFRVKAELDRIATEAEAYGELDLSPSAEDLELPDVDLSASTLTEAAAEFLASQETEKIETDGKKKTKNRKRTEMGE